MKKLSVFTIIFLMASGALASNAENRSYKFCDDITRVDKLLDRTRESKERIKRERLEIERIVVSKDRKEMYLISGETLLRKYTVAFGTSRRGHKQFQGDRKTPEGIYFISGKNPNSKFHLSLEVSYPNARDIAFARSRGQSPGGDIMIHGLPNPSKYSDIIRGMHPMDWTSGCIAVTDEEIEEVYSLVEKGTLIETCKMSEVEPPPRLRYEAPRP